MPGSNSLISNTYQGNALFDRADIRNLKVRDSLLVNNVNNVNNLENYTRDDALLVLITLYIKNAQLLKDRIIFTTDNLRLTQWDNRTLNSEKQHRSFSNHTNEEAKLILQGLFDKDIQGKYNATDNPPNAFLNTILNFETEYYITITGLEVNEDTITLYFEPEEGSPEIEEQESVDLRVVIDIFEHSGNYLSISEDKKSVTIHLAISNFQNPILINGRIVFAGISSQNDLGRTVTAYREDNMTALDVINFVNERRAVYITEQIWNPFFSSFTVYRSGYVFALLRI